ncbi:7326_t:CDS:2 [Acaulospora morrowiae]|uniref:7326_t:CDS:1 n=1 Tax=Acaulospora morrowiae TaxID=94023 RepID=A0A9N8VVJ2_9GLOM|nr:7326_t:CDS:2 [Acaulospora morrowiae]
MYMPYGTRATGGSRNQKAKVLKPTCIRALELAADYQELLKELSTPEVKCVGNYVLEKTLGEGTYGKVKLATHKLTSQKVAIKIIPKIHAENCTREIHHLRHLHHPNIISLLEIIPTESKIYMVLEYCEGGELYDFLVDRGGRLRENLARKIFGQLCRAVKYCHDRRIVHRDLKLENILLDANNNVKLGDFGFTRECESKKLLETICGSVGYSAPDAQDLISSILQLEPTERPSLKQILQHRWFTIKDEEEDDDEWDTTDDLDDSESISSATGNDEKEIVKPSIPQSKEVGEATSHLEHLERQRQEIFLITNHNAYSQQPTTSGQYNRNVENGTTSVPSAYESRLKGMTSTSTNTIPPRVWGPSTSKSSRRSSIDSKAFNERVFFTTPEEKELLEKLDNLGFDFQAIKNSVLEGKVDSASGLWWLLLTKLREKRRIEGTHSSITMVDVAVGTSDDEVELVDDVEEEVEYAESPPESNLLSRSSQEESRAKVEIPEEIMPPTPPPKTYHSAPASRERRKSLILSLPEAVEPVLTTITATASPPISPKKYPSFSPLSSRSGWWVGSNHKDSHKKNLLSWTESRVVVPTDVARSRSRINRRSGSKTPPNGDSMNLQRRSSSVSHGSTKDRKKKNRNSLQGNKGRRHNFPPLIIPPVTPSIVLSQNSPTGMLPIPGTPPAARSKTMFTINRRNPFAYPGASWGRKQVKRRSTGGSSINQLVENFNSTNESGSSEDINNKNHQEKKDTFEKSEIEDISTDVKNKKDALNIDEQSIIVESSKFKITAFASPPPTPPSPKKSTETSTPVQEGIDSSKADKSSFKMSEESLALSDDVSPPLSPTDNNDRTTTSLPPRRSNEQRLKPNPTRSSLSGVKGKNPEIIQLQSVTSTPPESPKVLQPSSPSIRPIPSKSKLRQSHSRAHSSPSVLKNVGKGDSDNLDETENIGVDIPNQKMGREETRFELRRDSSPSPPNVSVLNGAQRLFMQNNSVNPRRSLQNGFSRKTMNNFGASTDGNGFGAVSGRRPKITKPAMIMEEEEEE